MYLPHDEEEEEEGEWEEKKGGEKLESRDEACEDWETSWLMVLSQPKFKAKCEAAEVSHSLWVFDHVTV